MHAVLKDVFTLVSLAMTYFVVAEFLPIFGQYLTRHVILGVPLFGVLVRYRLHYVSSANDIQTNGGDYCGGHGQAGSDEEGILGITYPAMLRRTYSVEVSNRCYTRGKDRLNNAYSSGTRSILQGNQYEYTMSFTRFFCY